MHDKRQPQLVLDVHGKTATEIVALIRAEQPAHLVLTRAECVAELGALVEAALFSDPDLRTLTIMRGVEPGDAPHRHPRTANGDLTARECEVLRLAGQGFTNVGIAHLLWITPDTVKFHLRNSFRKLGVSHRGEAVQAAIDRGLLDPHHDGQVPHLTD